MKKIILFDLPTYGNVGDLAIAIAEEKFIKENLPQYEYRGIFDREVDHGIEKMKNEMNSEDVILLTGGGNLGDEYLFIEERRRKIISSFPNNKIIIMPQTIYFSNTEKGMKELEETKKIYNNHKNLTVVAREKVSFDKMKKEFSNVNVILTPDIVMYLNEKQTYKRKGVVMVMRDDLEKTLTMKEIEKIKSEVLKKFNNIITIDTHIGDGEIYDTDRREIVFKEKIEEFQKAQLVITDRLHGMIFAAITGTPCIAISNYNHKIESSFEWLRTQNYIKFLKDVKEIENAIKELTGLGTCEYNNEFALKEYNKILDVINC